MTPLRFAVLLGICIIWGFHFTVIKVTVDDIPPLFYASIRMAIVALILSPFLKWHTGQMGRVAIAGACFGGLNYAFMFSGLKLTTASLAAVMLETYVPLAALLSVIFLGEKIGWRRIAGLTLAFSGVIVIVSAGEEATGADNLLLGAGLVVGAALCEAVGAIMVKKVDGVSPLGLLAWFGVVGASVTGLLSLGLETDQLAVIHSDARWTVAAALAYSVLLASIAGHASYYWLLQRVEVNQVAGATVMATMFAVLFGVLLLGDPVTFRFLLGGTVTLVGVAIIVIRSGGKQRQAMATVSTAIGQDVGDPKP